MVMAPGLGKTVVSAFVLKSLLEQELQAEDKILFLCHDNYILRQAHAEYKETLDPEDDWGFEDFFGSIKNLDKALSAKVVFGSFQSMNSPMKWYQEFDQQHFAAIVVDEGHHAQASTFKEVLDYFDPRYSLGMTGTPDRQDNLDIRQLFGEESVNITIEEGIANGWLTKVEYHVLSDEIDKQVLADLFREVVVEKRRISVNQVNKLLFIKKRSEEQLSIIRERTGHWQKKCIIFCENIHHLRSLACQLDKGSYVTFHSKNTIAQNDENLARFRNGQVNLILSVDKFNEGIDVPDVEMVVFLRVTDSGIVYRQQLGRGLRVKAGKSQVVVLDFVANCERILLIQGMMEMVKYYNTLNAPDRSLLSVSGANYLFDFSDDLTDIIEILKLARLGFYATWQEASAAAIALGIRDKNDYRRRYKEDRQLPAGPDDVYADYPGARVFFGGQDLLSCEELQIAVRAAGIRHNLHYLEEQVKHGDWPYRPDQSYGDKWPGWKKFLSETAVEFLPFEQLQAEVRAAGIKTNAQYIDSYVSHAGWPSQPNAAAAYRGQWQGWYKFLIEGFEEYLSLEQLKQAVQAEGVKSYERYVALSPQHPDWPSHPEKFYRKEWSGWRELFGLPDLLSFEDFVLEVRAAGIKNVAEYSAKYKDHPGWHSAPYKLYKEQWTVWAEILGKYLPYDIFVVQVREAGIKNGKIDYKQRYKDYQGWPSNPGQFYKDLWPGWDKVLGTVKKEFIATWQEASAICLAHKVTGVLDYRQRHHSIDSRLPGNMEVYYQDWPGWDIFLGRTKKEFIATWQEASALCVTHHVSGVLDYRKRYQAIDSRLPYNPQSYYADWPGWIKFLNK